MPDLYHIAGLLLRALPPERAHRLAIRAMAAGFAGRASGADDPALAVGLWGKHFPNPIGLAAGFDKHGEVPAQALALGFGLTEIGSVTPEPQSGTTGPRLFRLTEDRAVINRMGFNSQGHAAVLARLAHRPRGMIGINLGRNKDSADAGMDYALGVTVFGGVADYLVANLSSPNTPGLRALQGRAPLEALLGRINEARVKLPQGGPPLLIKIAPDLVDDELADIAAVATAMKVDGLIVSNTTIVRPDTLRSPHKGEGGGLSGAPLFVPSTRMLAKMYALTEGQMPLIGCGGVASGADAYAKIRAGASLVQLYTALVFEGPGLVARIKHDLAAFLKRDGFARVGDAVGVDAKH